MTQLQHQIAINDWRIAQLEAANDAESRVEANEPFFSEYINEWGESLIRVGPTRFFFRKPQRHGYMPTLREADDAKNNTRTAKPGPFPPEYHRQPYSSPLPGNAIYIDNR